MHCTKKIFTYFYMYMNRNFSAVISDDYNYCYQFNGPADRTMARNSTGIGPNQGYFSLITANNIFFWNSLSSETTLTWCLGLTLVLYAEGLEKLKGFTQTKGFRVEIHPFKALSFPWTNGFYVSPGFETNVAIKLVRIDICWIIKTLQISTTRRAFYCIV